MNGLIQKYTVMKADGSPVDPKAEYFVLRLDANASDINHVAACRRAAHTYATEIELFLPELCADLRRRYPIIDPIGDMIVALEREKMAHEETQAHRAELLRRLNTK